MTTTDAATPKKEHSIMDAMKRGREYAATMVLVLTFLHSMYASYFKKEEVAEASYKTTSAAIEDYSRRVHDEIEGLKARATELETELTEAQKEIANLSKPLSAVPKLTQPVKPEPAFPKPKISIIVEDDDAGVSYEDIADTMATLVDHDSLEDLGGVLRLPAPADPLIVDMPDRPWEQQQKTAD